MCCVREIIVVNSLVRLTCITMHVGDRPLGNMSNHDKIHWNSSGFHAFFNFFWQLIKLAHEMSLLQKISVNKQKMSLWH